MVVVRVVDRVGDRHGNVAIAIAMVRVTRVTRVTRVRVPSQPLAKGDAIGIGVSMGMAVAIAVAVVAVAMVVVVVGFGVGTAVVVVVVVVVVMVRLMMRIDTIVQVVYQNKRTFLELVDAAVKGTRRDSVRVIAVDERLADFHAAPVFAGRVGRFFGHPVVA